MPYIKIRERNQLTLPKEVSTALHIKAGDFLDVSTQDNTVVLRPTRIVRFGTPEGEAEHRRATRDFQEGRYKSFDSIEGVAEFLGTTTAVSRPEEQRDVADRASSSELEPLIVSMARLVVKAMHENYGDPVAAAEALERLGGGQRVAAEFEEVVEGDDPEAPEARTEGLPVFGRE